MCLIGCHNAGNSSSGSIKWTLDNHSVAYQWVRGWCWSFESESEFVCLQVRTKSRPSQKRRRVWHSLCGGVENEGFDLLLIKSSQSMPLMTLPRPIASQWVAHSFFRTCTSPIHAWLGADRRTVHLSFISPWPMLAFDCRRSTFWSNQSIMIRCDCWHRDAMRCDVVRCGARRIAPSNAYRHDTTWQYPHLQLLPLGEGFNPV